MKHAQPETSPLTRMIGIAAFLLAATLFLPQCSTEQDVEEAMEAETEERTTASAVDEEDAVQGEVAIEGEYRRDSGRNEGEISVTALADGRYRVYCLAFYTPEGGPSPHFGELEFEATPDAGVIRHSEKSEYGGEPYTLSILFDHKGATVAEQGQCVDFGQGVTLAGRYERIR